MIRFAPPSQVRGCRREAGAFLIAGIILVVVVALMLSAMGYLYVSGTRGGTLHGSSEQAYFIAVSGLERATRASVTPILANRIPCAALTGNAAVTAVPVGKGQFTVSGGAPVYSATPATLTAALTAAATVIPVNSTAGYAAEGRIMVDRELIDYADTSASASVCGTAPCFVGARRGLDGTGAVAHSAGTRVGQFLCAVQSAGAVPDFVAPRARRTLTQATQLQEGWAVGAAGGVGSRPWFARFQETAWADFSDAAFNVNAQLNSISMISYADGFAVGDASGGELIYRWQSTGSGWVRMGPSAALPDVNLNAVYCVAGNDCWAVGDEMTFGPAAGRGETILHWDGALWSRVGPSGAVPDTNLNSVFCLGSSDCWAVGDRSGGEVIIRWTGGPNWVRYGPTGAIPNVDLYGLHCAANDDCWAVGDRTGGNSVIARWTGGPNWQNGPSVSPAVNARLNGVYCAGKDDCWAAGNRRDGSGYIARWTGGPNWVRQAGGIPNADLNAVTCVDSDDCWSVGDASGGELILKWDGAGWGRVGPVAGVGDRNLLAVDLVGAVSRAPSARKEIFP